ncbi:uncharacterized oxidoreductase TM_0325-like [Sitodiplosis mosellana]|uniref:uncharacterized oxidoreductase TM_0325-like n=1 Tax=Sitodiplosis mosellana TaxID=263140 RepID=UPI00244445C3|nr:uncharacterized oxidoreductase TM_0325-like [Sitodiplosis mosellana]
MEFTGKIIIVTGASSGIGAETARHLSSLGGNVVLVGRNESRLNKVADEIKSAGSPAPLPIVADVTKDTKRIVDETIKHFGRLDVLVNNAGINIEVPIMDATNEQFDQIFNTNVRGVIDLCQLGATFGANERQYYKVFWLVHLPKIRTSVVKMNFGGKVILVTGAASGIGATTAKYFAQLGGCLVIVDHNAEHLNDVAEEIIAEGSHVPLAIVADITENPEHIITKTIEKFGKLDVLVNNAGIASHNGLTDLDMNDFDRIHKTNVRSVVFLTQSAIPYLEVTKGNIVNVSSICGLRACPQLLAYSMSKAAINQFTKCTAVELGPKGIRVNSVNPAVTNTPMIDAIPEETREKTLKYLKRAYPLQRIGETSDVANAIAYLASENAAFITGHLFCVDGGSLAANIV